MLNSNGSDYMEEFETVILHENDKYVEELLKDNTTNNIVKHGDKEELELIKIYLDSLNIPKHDEVGELNQSYRLILMVEKLKNEVNKANSLATEIALGLTHYSDCSKEMPCIRCQLETLKREFVKQKINKSNDHTVKYVVED